MQASLVVRHAPAPIAAAFLDSRLGAERGHVYGTLRAGYPVDDIVALAMVGQVSAGSGSGSTRK
jgi:putative acyl-CoA dehydrogenase